jgi:cyclopropane fatty-acyl-phospholipid synthase-like methyltransferase
MRVLDLGCGHAVSSVFFAREFDVDVFAVDLLLDPSNNWRRVEEAGVAGRVVPLRCDARSLPFPNEFFDAVVGLNSFQYFATDDLFLRQLLPLIRPGGRVGMVMTGLRHEVDRAPDHLRPHWLDQFETFHDPSWWRRHWERSGLVEVEVADLVPDGWSDWLAWRRLALAHGSNSFFRKLVKDDVDTLREDGGELLGLVRAVARRLDE